MTFRCYIIEYFVKDNLLSNLFKDECDTPFVMYSDLCVYSTKFLCREIWGVTIGIRAGRSVRPSRESSDIVLELEYYVCIILTYVSFVEN